MFDITLIHPAVVHFAIALFSTAVLLEILGAVTKKEKYHSAAGINLILAGISIILAAGSGLLAEQNVVHTDAAHEIMETHKILGLIVAGMVMLLVAWRARLKGKFSSWSAWTYVLAGVVAVGLMFTGAYLGGEMVYLHGVAVKAAPVSGEEAAHHHEERDSHSHDQGEVPSPRQTPLPAAGDEKQQTDTSGTKETRKKVHIHSDGSEHEH
jgi:uncharacterized membrane protein